jgi:hypothetical protein
LRIDVEKSASHQLSQTEIANDNPCSQQFPELRDSDSFPVEATMVTSIR